MYFNKTVNVSVLKLFIHTEKQKNIQSTNVQCYTHYHPNVNHHYVNTHHEIYDIMKKSTLIDNFNNKNNMVFVPFIETKVEYQVNISEQENYTSLRSLTNNEDIVQDKMLKPITSTNEHQITKLFTFLHDMKDISLVSIEKIKLFIENYNNFAYETNSTLCNVIPIESVQKIIENYMNSCENDHYNFIMSIVLLFQQFCSIRIGILDGLHRNFMLLEKEIIQHSFQVQKNNTTFETNVNNYTIEQNNVLIVKWNSDLNMFKNMTRYQMYSSLIVKKNEKLIGTSDWDIIEQFPRFVHEKCLYHSMYDIFIVNGVGCRTWKQSNDLSFQTEPFDDDYKPPNILQTLWKSHIKKFRTSVSIKIFNDFVSYFNSKAIEKTTMFDLCDTKIYNQAGQEILLEYITQWNLCSGLESPNVTSLTQHLLCQNNKNDATNAIKLKHFKYFFKSCKEEMTHNKQKDGPYMYFGVSCLINFF